MLGSVYNTTIFLNGNCVGRSSYNSLMPFNTCSYSNWSPSFFNYGFCQNYYNPFEFGAGYAAGTILAGSLPAIFKGVANCCSWMFNNVLSPLAGKVFSGGKYLWNQAIKPAAKWVGNGIATGSTKLWNSAIKPAAKWVGNGIASAAKWAGNGCKTLWNKVFHKNASKAEKTDA